MKILLVNLPWVKDGRWGVRAGSRWPHIKDPQTEGDYQPYPFYLGYAAALLKREGFEVCLLDCLAEKIDTPVFLQRVKEFSPDLIFSEVSTVSLKNDLEILSRLQEYPLAIGGADFNIRNPAFLKQHSFLDFVLVGEYEVTLYELAKNLREDKNPEEVEGIILREPNNKIKVAPPRPLLKDLDWLPWPLREELPMEKYIDLPGGLPLPSCQMWTSRGCPFQCIFCAWPQLMYGGNRFRARDPVKVVDEMEFLIKKMHFQSIYIDDDTTNVGKSRMKKLAREILRRGLKFPWAIMARPDLMDEDVLEILREAGLHSIKYGVESASQEILDRTNKKMNLEKAERMIRFTRELGIRTHLTFTFGLPGESRETIKRTIDFALSLNPDSVQFSIATPFPGTSFYQEMKKKGFIHTEDYSLYDGNYRSVVKTDNLSAEELEEARGLAYRAWGEHLKKRTALRLPVERRYIRTLSFYLKHYGLRATLRKIKHFSAFLLKHNLRKLTARRRSLSSPPLHFQWIEGKGVLHYQGKEVTQGVGLNLSFRIKDEWFDTSLTRSASCRKRGGNLYLRFNWHNLPLLVSFRLRSIPGGINLKATLKTFRKLRIQEAKFVIHLSHRYLHWFTEMENGKFPLPSNWEEIPLVHPWVRWIGVRECGEGSALLPALSLESIEEGRIGMENSPPLLNTRILKISLPEKVFPPGDSCLTALNLRLGNSREEVFPPKKAARRSIPKLIKTTLQLEGVNGVLRRGVKHLKPSFYLKNSLTLAGIFQGKKAYQGPSFVQIDVTNMCNNQCIGCWCNSPLLKDKKMPEEVRQQTLPLSLLKELIDELHASGCQEIYYSGGGEPFMHPHMLEIARYTKEKGLTCYINTNFTLMDKEKIDALIEIGVDHLTVSIWAGTSRTYALTHPGRTEADFERIKDNLSYLNKNKKGFPLVKIYNVIFNLNYQEIEEMVELAWETGSESVEFTVIDTIPNATDILLLSEEQQKELIEICNKLKKKREEGWAREVVLFNFEQFFNRISQVKDAVNGLYDRWIIGKIPCYIGWVFTRILPDGNVNGCLKAHRIPLGNIFQERFSTIWNSPPYQEFRHKTLTFDKDDPFFCLIGNDPDCQVGCYKSCDDLQRNLRVHEKILSLSSFERYYLKKVAKLLPAETKENANLPPDPLLAGIKQGRKAFTGPEQVVIDPTNRCNLRCISCWLYSPLLQKDRPSPEWLRKELPRETLLKLLDDLSSLGTKKIRFTGGGEPFMYKHLMEAVEYARKKGLAVAITTNFGLISRKNIKRLIETGIEELCISIWASNPGTYTKVHPHTSPLYFKKLQENLTYLKEIKQNKPRVTFANVIMNSNFTDFKDMYRFGLEHGADALYFTLVDVFPQQTDSLLLKEEERKKLLNAALQIREQSKKDNIELEFFPGFLRRISRSPEDFSKGEYDRIEVESIPCYVGWIFARILSDGSVAPCCRGVKKIMGNINTDSFPDIWFSPPYNEFRAKAKYLSKSHPYFKEIGCMKECDNLMHNQEIHRRLKKGTEKGDSPLFCKINH